MVKIISVRHMWYMEGKEELGQQTKGLSTQRREPPFLINEEMQHLQMDKCSVTLSKNMHF